MGTVSLAGLRVEKIRVVHPKQVRMHEIVRRLQATPRPDLASDLIDELREQGVRAELHCVTADGQHGNIPVRIADLPSEMLLHTLTPDSTKQEHVRPSDLATARQILEAHPQALGRFQPVEVTPIDWATLPFGLNTSVAMFFAEIERPKAPQSGIWQKAAPNLENCIYPFGNFPISPAGQVLHYAQTVFEGAKARVDSEGRIISFRLMENCHRLIRSCLRVALNPATAEFYYEAIRQTVLANAAILPPAGSIASMYIRPFQFGIGPQIGVAPSPREAFMIIVSPVGPYFKHGFEPIVLRTSTGIHRAMPYGPGSVKAGSNYIQGLIEAIDAKAKGFGEVLWLSLDNQFVEEAGAANFGFRIGNKVYTAKATNSPEGTILPGITRDCWIKIQRYLGYEVVEGNIPLALAMQADEAWCSGTAAVITPVGGINHSGQPINFNNGEVGSLTRLTYDILVAIQEARFDDPIITLNFRPEQIAEFRSWIDVLAERSPQ